MMTFSLHQGGVVMSSQITHTQSSKIHPLAHTYLTPAPWFSVVVPFLQFIPTASRNGILPSPGNNHQSTGGRSERTQGQAKMVPWNSFSYICTRALYSFQSLAHCCAASTVIPLLPKATITPSIQPNLGLPRARPPLTSAMNTLLAYGAHPFFPRAQNKTFTNFQRIPEFESRGRNMAKFTVTRAQEEA